MIYFLAGVIIGIIGGLIFGGSNGRSWFEGYQSCIRDINKYVKEYIEKEDTWQE